MKSSTSALKHQVMRLAVGEDADLLQIHLKVETELVDVVIRQCM